MQIKGIDGQFLLKTPSDPSFSVQAKSLLEARVPAVNAPTAQNALIQQLLHDGYAHTYELQLNADKRFQSGAIAVDRQTNNCLTPTNTLNLGSSSGASLLKAYIGSPLPAPGHWSMTLV